MAKDVLWLDGVVGSQLRDTQGEMLSVDGADISELQAGRGRWNDNHGKGFFNSIGRITLAKKIYSADDCDDDRQRYFWEKVKAPYIYAKGYLYNDQDHMNAKAAAAILRNIHKADAPLKLKASVEGGVVARGIKDQSLLAQTKIHSVALTFTPANQATLIEPLNLDKSAVNDDEDAMLIKSVLHLAETNVPSFRHITRVASAEKIRKNVHKIKEMISQIPEEELDKSLKGLAGKAAMAGAMALAPNLQAKTPVAPREPKAIVQQQALSPEDVVSRTQKVNPNLWAIAQTESSGGKNLNHATLESGMHQGQTAGGPWGMMPKTAAYVLKTSAGLAKKYPELAKLALDVAGNHKAITKQLNANPKLAHEFANTLYNHLHRVNKGNLDRVIHSWHYGLQGTNNAAKKFGEENIRNDEYVNKIKNALSTLPKPKLKKALTAGYGGASAPTSRTQGSVLMTEKMDNGRTGFKYVTCDNCGEEQIYGKNQVKCRNPQCGKSFSLASLYKVMLGKDKR